MSTFVSPDVKSSFIDYPSPIGASVTFYFYNCCHECNGCHSAENLKFVDDRALHFEYDQFVDFVKLHCSRNYTKTVVFQGGDPLHDANFDIVSRFCKEYGDVYKICIFTGFEKDEVISKGLEGFTFIKCGKFDITKSRPSYKKCTEYVLASTNQNFFDKFYNQISTNGVLTF